MKITKGEYRKYLNSLGVPEDDKKENGGRISWKWYHRWGDWLYQYDRIAFNVGYNDWKRSIKP